VNLQSFYSKGKFLITSEYLILKGATGLALPLKFGQKLTVTPSGSRGIITWETRVQGTSWFKARFNTETFGTIKCSQKETADNLVNLFSAARELNPGFIKGQGSFNVLSEINFNINWGLGSSSSLISNIAWWAKTDPYNLHFRVSSGSGYDIACARSDKPLLYSVQDYVPQVVTIDFKPNFKDSLFFVYSGRKQRSDKSVSAFNNKSVVLPSHIDEVNEITKKITEAKNITEFNDLISRHEQLISGLIGVERIKTSRFKGFPGEIKSLGAWGGDFLLVTWDFGEDRLIDYFSAMDMHTLFKFDQIIL